MVIKVYISGLSGNKEVKKRQQRVTMILQSKHIEFIEIDIATGNTEEKEFMQANALQKGSTISDPTPRYPLPPQVFNDSVYCGDYDAFDAANEEDKLEEFLKLRAPTTETTTVATKNGVGEETAAAAAAAAEETTETADENKTEDNNGGGDAAEDTADGANDEV
uniref:Uncharacterized protein n=1 Tax=Anopheles darlingi TaxID=43151 RepID=A0A2M4CJC3_ANODA